MAGISESSPNPVRRFGAAVGTWYRRAVASVDEADVLAYLATEGGFTVRYAVLVLLSCGIAILGLLLSSPAVVIGAMLISPLMNPIILFGFSLTILDYRLAWRSFVAVSLGAVIAVGFAALIVWLSPLYSATPEILARTRPNFFDLLVAVFSAVAGGFAVTHRRGETIVGVAIATALMPPLAVTGYGLAVGNWAIFIGAGELFMTDLLAIALTVSLVARFFGFGAHNSPSHTFWQTGGILAVFAVLSVPLGIALQQIAREAVITTRARTALETFAHARGDEIFGFTANFPAGEPVHIGAMVLTRNKPESVEPGARAVLRKALAQPADLSLSVVEVGAHASLDQQAVESLIAKSQAQNVEKIEKPPLDVAQAIAAEGGFGRLSVAADPRRKRAIVHAGAERSADLAGLRADETRLASAFPDWKIAVQPQLATAYRIAFAEGKTGLDDPSRARLHDIAWALAANGVHAAEVTGHADGYGGTVVQNRHAALRRATAVAEALTAAGIAATAHSEYPAPDQRARARQEGLAAFRTAEIHPISPISP